MAADLSCRLGHLGESDVVRVRQLVARAGLPIAAPPLDPDRYLDLMSFDKKAQGGRVRFILLKRMGNAYIHNDAPADRLAETLAACASPA